MLRYLLDEAEFLSPFGIRSLSKFHAGQPEHFQRGRRGASRRLRAGESTSGLFGGNSNWRGPVWFPVNYLLVEALERFHHFYGNDVQVEFPTGSGRMLNLRDIGCEIERRLASLFLPDENGRRACHGDDPRFATDPHWRELVLFHEYFHGESGKGLGASHQTGWTALVIRLLKDAARKRGRHLARRGTGAANGARDRRHQRGRTGPATTCRWVRGKRTTPGEHVFLHAERKNWRCSASRSKLAQSRKELGARRVAFARTFVQTTKTQIVKTPLAKLIRSRCFAGLCGGVLAVGFSISAHALEIGGRVVEWQHSGVIRTDLPAGSQHNVKAIASGFAYRLALRVDGTVTYWGWRCRARSCRMRTH